MIEYKKVPRGYELNHKFDTWILAFCPDTLDWFATNERFFFYEYNKEFNSEQEEAIDYFLDNALEFYKIEEQIMKIPEFTQNKLWLSNLERKIELY